jgi:CHASE1-domain containing sensor protein
VPPVFGALIVLLSGLLMLGIVRQKRFLESQQSFNQLI